MSADMGGAARIMAAAATYVASPMAVTDFDAFSAVVRTAMPEASWVTLGIVQDLAVDLAVTDHWQAGSVARVMASLA